MEKKETPKPFAEGDADFIRKILPGWCKETPEDLPPMSYHTLSAKGDLGLRKRIDRILAAIDSAPCPHCYRATDGVHVVLVDRCNHPDRDEWAKQRPVAKSDAPMRASEYSITTHNSPDSEQKET